MRAKPMIDAVDGRRPLAWRIAIGAITAAAFVLFAWVAAHWIWRWVTPAPVVQVAPAPADPAATILASGLWAGGDEAPAATVATSSGDIRLVGVLAERDGNGLAVFRTREGARVVANGADIVPGTRLLAVEPWSVRIAEAAGERTLELRRDPIPASPATAKRAAAPVRTLTPPSSSNPACAVPAGFSGAVLKLHAELLAGLIAQPESWRAMLAAENGALVVREDGGFASMLGLTRGDRLVQANGIALQQPDDVTGAVLRPLAASQPVRIVGARGSQPREVLVVNAGACP
ncbi:MAG: hypothetical protein ABI585_04635 [Betaproteobacteria bacterium]